MMNRMLKFWTMYHLWSNSKDFLLMLWNIVPIWITIWNTSNSIIVYSCSRVFWGFFCMRKSKNAWCNFVLINAKKKDTVFWNYWLERFCAWQTPLNSQMKTKFRLNGLSWHGLALYIKTQGLPAIPLTVNNVGITKLVQ